MDLWIAQGELADLQAQTMRKEQEVARFQQIRDDILRSRGVNPVPPAAAQGAPGPAPVVQAPAPAAQVPVAAAGAPAPAGQAPAQYTGPPYPKLDCWYGIPQGCVYSRTEGGVKRYFCRECGKEMGSRAGGLGHYRRVHATRIHCRFPGCSFRVNSVRNLMVHEQTDHSRPPLRACEETDSEN